MDTLIPSHGRKPISIERPAIRAVLFEHVEEAVHLRKLRSVLVREPHVGLLHLSRLDERIEAHLDGLAVAGDRGVKIQEQALERPGAGEVFVATVGAICSRDSRRLGTLLAIAEALPVCRAGALSAFGWVSAVQLKGITNGLLESTSPWSREVALAACAMHGVDSGDFLANALDDPNSRLRARTLRAAGRVGRVDLVDHCLGHLADDDAQCAFEAARSSVLLGDRNLSISALETLAHTSDPGDKIAQSAFRFVLLLVSTERARAALSILAKDSAQIRRLMHGIAVAGDTHYVPWLIGQMADLKLARLAGETFSFITGLDLAQLGLDRTPPDKLEFGPNDDPNDDAVAMDEDDGLPWPDPQKISAWWHANGHKFRAGTRYFMGEPPSTAHCISVLKSGFQRQRIAAAEYLSLLRPGTPVFNVAAPARRQQRLLANMVA